MLNKIGSLGQPARPGSLRRSYGPQVPVGSGLTEDCIFVISYAYAQWLAMCDMTAESSHS